MTAFDLLNEGQRRGRTTVWGSAGSAHWRSRRTRLAHATERGKTGGCSQGSLARGRILCSALGSVNNDVDGLSAQGHGRERAAAPRIGQLRESPTATLSSSVPSTRRSSRSAMLSRPAQRRPADLPSRSIAATSVAY